MTPENFCYWLQGVFEVSNPQEMTKEQLTVIREHLQLVFTKVTTTLVKADEPNKNGDIFTKQTIEDIYKKGIWTNHKPLSDSKPYEITCMYGPQASC